MKVALYLDPQQYPHWMNLDIAWLKSEIRKASLKPRIILVSDRKPTTGQTDLYTLFDGNETNISTQNLYQIDLKLDFTKSQNEAFLSKTKN